MISNKGYLSKQYAIERMRKPEFKFRLAVRAQITADAVQKHLSENSNLNVLDFGAAEGLTLMKLSALLPENQFIGIEYSRELIESSIIHSPNIKLIQGDATKLPDILKNDRFDVISALAFLEHLKSPNEALDEAYRVLRPGGLFIATCPEPLWDSISCKLGLLKDNHHETKMSKKYLKKITVDAGFRLLEYRRFMWAPISFLPYLRIPISPYYSSKFDRWINNVKILNWLFVNQVIICQKPQLMNLLS